MATTFPTAAALGVDVFDPRVFARSMPWADFARLQAEAPVCWHTEREVLGWPAGPGFWAVTRHDDIRTVGRDPGLYSSWLRGTQLRDPEEKDLAFWREMLLNMDPPGHTRLRRIVGSAFTAKVLAQREPVVRRRARELVDAIAGAGTCDFAEAIGAELPLRVMTEVLGLPESDRHLLARWVNRVIGYQDDELAEEADDNPVKVNPRSREALSDMLDYAGAMADEKRRRPGDDLLSILVQAEIDGERLTRAELETFFFLFTVAGNDTTHSALPGGLLALIESPEQLARLVAEPPRLPAAVEEILRFAPPVIHFRRTASHDTVLAGQPIAAGDKVAVFYAAGNRDPRAIAEPDRFDITRPDNPHLGFGTGAHVCIGAGLARLQLRALFDELLGRLDHFELDGPVVRLQSNFINGIKRLPIRYRSSERPRPGAPG